MQKQKMGKTKIFIVAALFYPACALAQISGATSGGGAHGSSMGAGTTTGVASDQAHISPPGTNSLGTANSSGLPGGTTVGANMEPQDSRRIDAEIRDENSRVDSKTIFAEAAEARTNPGSIGTISAGLSWREGVGLCLQKEKMG